MSISDGDPAVADLVARLRRTGLQITDDADVRERYSADASLYRIPPAAVAFPRRAEDVEAILTSAGAEGVAVTARGAGTSVAGNAIGPGVVLDFSRYMNRVVEIDSEAATALVEPGVVQADLQRAAAPHGLRFGPDPSTRSQCTIGGMIGNDACGPHSLGYGRTSDNVMGLGAFLADGTRVRTELDHDGRPSVRQGQDLVRRIGTLMSGNLAVARDEFDRRRISGYAVRHLLPEHFDLTSVLVGSGGTLAVVTDATVRLVPEPGHRVLVVLGFDDIVAAADACPAVVAHGPTTCDGLDTRLIETIRSRRGHGRVPELPSGRAWLFVEFASEDRATTLNRAAALVAGIGAVGTAVIIDPGHADAFWRIREDGVGLAGVAPSGRPAWPGWRDAAVPPDALGRFLREFDDLVAVHGMRCAPFGHFGDGCVHLRLDFQFERTGAGGGSGAFLREAAALVARCGGTFSGDHGDGHTRDELVPSMYSPEAIRLVRGIKHVFDPGGTLNPGILADPVQAARAARDEGHRSPDQPLDHECPELPLLQHVADELTGRVDVTAAARTKEQR